MGALTVEAAQLLAPEGEYYLIDLVGLADAKWRNAERYLRIARKRSTSLESTARCAELRRNVGLELRN